MSSATHRFLRIGVFASLLCTSSSDASIFDAFRDALMPFRVKKDKQHYARLLTKHDNAGHKAEAAGDLHLARENWALACSYAKKANDGGRIEAYARYNWSRASGHLGMHAEAENGFDEVLGLLSTARDAPQSLLAPTLSEYARFLHDTRQHAKAIPLFERAVPALEAVDAEHTDPLGFAVFLEDYATSLQAVGENDRATGVTRRVQRIRAGHHPSERPQFVVKRYQAKPVLQP